MGFYELGQIGTADVSAKQLAVNIYIPWDQFRKLYSSQVGKLSKSSLSVLQAAFKKSPVKIKKEADDLDDFFIKVKVVSNADDDVRKELAFRWQKEEEVEKKRRELEQERVEQERKRAELAINSDSKLLEFVRKYAFNQLKDMQARFQSLQSGELDAAIEQGLRGKFPRLVQFLGLIGITLSEADQAATYQLILRESEPIWQDLRAAMAQHEAERARQQKQEEERRRLEEKKQLSAELFGEEIVTPEDVQRVEQYKSVPEVIDELLQKYKDWENAPKS